MSSSKTSQKKEIIWNIINAGLAGVLVLLGSLTSGGITPQGFCAAFIAALVVIVAKFADYWKAEESEYKTSKLFTFITL